MKKKKAIPVKNYFLEVPRLKKRRFLKAFFLVSFFIGANFIYQKLTYETPLPYKDDQELPEKTPDDKNDIIEQIELDLAMQAYNHLLDSLYTKANRLGLNLNKDFLIKLVAYNNMTNSIEVVLQDKNKTVILNFSPQNLEKLTFDPNAKYSNQISNLAQVLNAPILSLPTTNKFDSKLNNVLNQNVASGIKYYSNSNVLFSSGDERNEIMDDLLLTGRDYMFFNVYGKGYKNGVEYNVVSIVSMSKDNFEILGEPDLIDLYLKQPNNPNFSVNVLYQENQTILEKLNTIKTKENSLEK